MSVHFEFTFLGPKHCYVASVTQVTGSGYLIRPLDTACFRAPKSFTEEYERSARTRYISNIRGHDFLCYVGQWASEDDRGIQKSENIINEIDSLRSVGQELKEKGYKKADLKLSLGPGPGSYFADVKKLNIYRWEEVPRDLNNAIKDEMAKRGYGKISDVAMNASGGWVMHFREPTLTSRFKRHKRAAQFCWGGAALPSTLETALQNGRDRGAMIRHIFLNHQNPDEYLLLFSDGYAHANLHCEFQDKIKGFVESWVINTLKKVLTWEFTYSCKCLGLEQQEVDAAYYIRRSHFYILRSLINPGLSSVSIDIALQYLYEAKAITHDPKAGRVNRSLRLALVAARRIKDDRGLEANIAEAQMSGLPHTSLINTQDRSAKGIFRNSYLQLITSEDDYRDMERQLDELNLFNTEWSYSLASCNEMFSPIENYFGGDFDQRRNSTTPVPEMSASIPSIANGLGVIARERATEQSNGHHTTVQSQRRLFELDDNQSIPSRRRTSVVSSVQSPATQWRTPSFSSGQSDPAERQLPELSSNSAIEPQRKSSGFSMTTLQSVAHGREPERAIIERRTSELASNEIVMVQKRSEPSAGRSFNIYQY